MRRTQIYLEDKQDDDLARRAAAEGVTKSALIRRAVDEYLDNKDADDELRLARFRAAVDAVAGAAPDLPQGLLYVERLRAIDAGRQEEIERRRRA
jgi:hypothetical protein